MRNSSRHYPDISFVDKDTERLVARLIASYELFTGRKLYPADPTRLFILWIADIIMQERVIIDKSAKQNVARYAEGEYLDSLAEIFKDTPRLQAQAAITTLRFHISAPQLSAITIPKGTRVTVDGEITFDTSAAVEVSPGEIYADAPAICQTAGKIGNGFVPGQITQAVDIFPHFDSVENITTSESGADTETDDAYYDRLSNSMEAFSTAGAVGAYEYWAKTASAAIVDVKPTSPEPGVADIRVLLAGGELPDVEMIQKVYDTLNEDKTRPFTDFVQVSAPDVTEYDLDLTYYIPSPRANSAAVIQAEAAKAIEQFKRWQSEKMGRDINPDILIQLLQQAGAKRAEIRSPAFTVIGDTEVAILRGEIVIYGGIEDE